VVPATEQLEPDRHSRSAVLELVPPKCGDEAARRRWRIREGLQKGTSIRASQYHALVFLENAARTLICEIACRQARHRRCAFDELANGWCHTEFHSLRLALACVTLLRCCWHT